MKAKGSASARIGFLLITVLLTCFLPTKVMSQAGSFTGNWITSLGLLDIGINGSNVSGSYISGSLSGDVEGKLSRDGKLLTGTWSLDKQGGRFIIRLTRDGNAFNGRWWKGMSQPGGEWIGIRKNSTASEISAATFKGAWVSNYGNMNLGVEGVRVSGNFSGKRNRGTVSGQVDQRTHKLIGAWEDTDHKGRLILNLVEGGNSFIGEWWFEDNTYGGYWYAVRYSELEGCISGDCDGGNGTYVWSDGSRYEGEWRDKRYNGSGRKYDPVGNLKYKGVWVEGVYQGDCTSGDCTSDSGSLTLINGDRYEGSFVECLPEGTGIYHYRNGDTYEGEFKGGFSHGNGTLIWAVNGDKYVGNFSRGKIQGEGTYYFKNGDVYEGNFRRGERYGQGKMAWVEGDRYEGEWENDTMSGKGTYTYKNGDVYSGHFENGLKSGEGTYTFANGNTILAVWKDDKVNKFDSSSSGYSGLAEQSSTPSLPVTMENKNAGSLVSAQGDSRESIFIAYKIKEVTPPGSTPENEQKEVFLTCYIVQGPEDLDEAAAKTIIKDRTGVDIGAGYRVEKVPNPNVRVKQILGRYRYGLVKTRVNPSFEGYFYSGE